MRKIRHRIWCRILFILVLFSMITNIPHTVQASTLTKVQKSYDIAVVFDNSGSMYDGKAWCRAKYAMEIFASMMNYENGDRLRIFPMWEVKTDGSKPKSGGSYKAIEIANKEDIDKISNLYTVHPSNTPFAPVLEAQKSLKKSKATEKWIVVLTDGEFNQIKRGKTQGTLSNKDLKNRLLKVAGDGIKVQYLGFAEASKLSSEEKKGFYAKKSTDTSLKDDLIGICNRIFQRSVLPNNRLSGKNLNLDMSMRNLIVFVQGSNAKIHSLKNEKGQEVSKILDSGQRKYSSIKANGYENAKVDKSLAGQVVTFSGCPKGSYTLDYSGADAIQMFYEPDVDVTITLTNNDGEVIDGSAGDVVVGEYTINSKIVDAKTGEDVTSHELLGDVKLMNYVKTSKESNYKAYKNGDKLTLYPDSETDIYAVGNYLKDYTITSESNEDLQWMRCFAVIELDSAFQLKAKVLQKDGWYTISDHKNWKPIQVQLTLEGNPLTKEQMDRVDLQMKPSSSLPFRYEKLETESGYKIYIGQDEGGKYQEPEIGEYELTFTGSYTDEYGKETVAKDEAKISIQKYSKWLKILFWIIIFLVLLIIWIMCMRRKVMPKMMRKDSASFECASAGTFDGNSVKAEFRRKGRSLSIAGPTSVEYDEQCSAIFNVKPIDNHFTKSKKRRMAITGIDSACEEVKISGTSYVPYEGRWIKKNTLNAAMAGKVVPPIEHELSCNPRFELIRQDGLSRLVCKTKTIK